MTQEQGELPEHLFTSFCDAIDSETPPEIKQNIIAGLRRRFESDRTSDYEVALGRAVPPDRLRHLLFAPDASDMELYVRVLSLPAPGSVSDSPIGKAQATMATVLYLVHARAWATMAPFVKAGGLVALAGMLHHPQVQLRAQSLETLLLATSNENFDWFSLPAGVSEGETPLKGPEGGLFQGMLAISKTTLVRDLLSMREPPFPGASYLALQFFAFYASWLRFWFCPGKVLRLGGAVLEELRKWGDSGEEQEKELARTLYEDFSRFPPAQEDPGSTLSDEGALEGDDLETRVVADRTVVNSGGGEFEGPSLKDKGNACFRSGDWDGAVELYSRAIDCPVPAHELMHEAPRRAIYHSNRAAAYLARATGLVEGKYRSGTDTHGHLGGRDVDGTPESIALQLRAAVMDCDSAIEFDSKLCKAWMRKAQAHARLGEVAEAERAYDRAMEVAGPGARGKVARDKAKWLRSARCATGTKDSDADGSLEEGPTQVRKVRKAGGQGRGHDSGQRGEDERENGPSDEGMARAGLPRGRGALSQAEDAGAGNTTTGRNASDMMAMLLGGASGDGGREDAGSGGGGVGMKVVQTRRVGGGWFDKSDLDEMD